MIHVDKIDNIRRGIDSLLSLKCQATNITTKQMTLAVDQLHVLE